MRSPRTCKHLCPGFSAGQNPCKAGMNRDDFPQGPLPCFEFTRNKCKEPCTLYAKFTKEEWEQESTRREKEMQDFVTAVLPSLVKIKAENEPGSSGFIDCPKCGKKLQFAIGQNKHVHAVCESSDCVQVIE